MKFFNLASHKKVDEYARNLAQEFARVCPLSAKYSGKAVSPGEKKVEQALAGIYARAKAFRQEHRLGVLNRARLAKRFQAELSNMGYPSELVNQVTTALVAAALTGD